MSEITGWWFDELPFYTPSLVDMLNRQKFHCFTPGPTKIERACHERALQACADPIRDGFVCMMHDEAIVWNHCENMASLADSALWMMK